MVNHIELFTSNVIPEIIEEFHSKVKCSIQTLSDDKQFLHDMTASYDSKFGLNFNKKQFIIYPLTLNPKLLMNNHV